MPTPKKVPASAVRPRTSAHPLEPRHGAVRARPDHHHRAKARTLRPVAEKLITKAKKGDLHNRREVLKTIRDKSVVHVLFTEIAPTFAERPGGYTRITKVGPRKGDNAPMAVIELVTEAYAPKPAKAKAAKAEAPRGRSGRGDPGRGDRGRRGCCRGDHRDCCSRGSHRGDHGGLSL